MASLTASRTSCVSPCTVMMSIDGVRDETVEHPFVELGVYWDYDDPDALPAERGAQRFLQGQGAPRTHDVNTPLGMHTYTCGNYLGTPQGVRNNAARITVAPTKAQDAESTYAAVVSGNVIDLSEDALPENDIVLSGRGLACYADHRTQTRGGCSDGGRGSIPEDRYAPALIDLPVPDSPGPP